MTIVTNVYVLFGPPGCGKTAELRSEMLTRPDRYLFAMPRNDLIEERVRDLRASAFALGVNPVIVPIHSNQGERAPVRRRIKEAALKYRNDHHVIMLISHEALKSADLTELAGWHARIDEVPDAVASDTFRIPASWRLFTATYDLLPVPETKWSRVIARADAPSLRDLLKDDIAGDLSAFHKHALSPQGAYVDLTDWSEASDRRQVRWWAAWTPLELAHFASIKVAASGYFNSLLHHATEAWFPGQVQLHRQVVGAGRTAWPTVRVHYYTRGHRASTAFWKADQGRECLNKVGRHLAGLHNLGYWSGNEIVLDRFGMSLAGLMVSPKQAGTNAYRHLTSCAMIYSNKAQRADEAILEVFGLSKEHVERARQTEDIEQFVMRGAIRCADFGGAYDIYVYDLWQAEAVMRFLQANGIGDVELIGLDEVGIMDEERPRSGRKPLSSDPAVLKLRDEDRREKDRLRKEQKRAEARRSKAENGTLRKPGRPPNPTLVR